MLGYQKIAPGSKYDSHCRVRSIGPERLNVVQCIAAAGLVLVEYLRSRRPLLRVEVQGAAEQRDEVRGQALRIEPGVDLTAAQKRSKNLRYETPLRANSEEVPRLKGEI